MTIIITPFFIENEIAMITTTATNVNTPITLPRIIALLLVLGPF